MLFMKRGEAHLKQMDYEAAEKDFREANLIYPGVADLWLARCFALSGDQQQAITFLTSHLNSEFRAPEDSIKKDRAFDDLQTSDAWYNLWEKDWYTEDEKLTAEIHYYCRKEQYEQAEALINSQLTSSPENSVLYSLRGKTDYEQGNYATAIADYTKALSLDKNFTAVYSRRGMASLKAGRFKDALNDLNKAIREDPADFGLYLKRAEAQAGLKSWEPAIRDLQLYLKYFDNDQNVLHRCGEYFYESEDYINALKYFNRNLLDDPNNSVYYKSRGKTYLKSATYRYAISDLSMSLDLDPDDAETWMYLGMAKIMTGDKENGCSDLQKAQRMGNTEAVKYILENCR
jgi:tetratricopeptide (TPR) repeat protein